MFKSNKNGQTSNLFNTGGANNSWSANNDNKQSGAGGLFPKSGSNGLFSNKSQTPIAPLSGQSTGGLFTKETTSTGGLFQKGTASTGGLFSSQSSQPPSSNLFKSSGSPSLNAGQKSSLFSSSNSNSSNNQLFSSKSNSTQQKSPLFSNSSSTTTTSSSGGLFANSTAPKKSIFATSSQGSSNTSSNLFSQQVTSQQPQQYQPDIFDIKKGDQAPIEHHLFPQAQKQKIKSQGHVFPQMKELKEVKVSKNDTFKSSSNTPQMALFSPSKQQKSREQKKVRFNLQQPFSDEQQAAKKSPKAAQTQQNNTKSMVQLKFKVINAIQNKLAIQISSGKLTLQKAQQLQSQYQHEVFNNNNIPQQLLNLVQSTHQQKNQQQYKDPFSTISLGDFISLIHDRWQETKVKYEYIAQHIRQTEHKYFQLKKMSDSLDQMTELYTMRFIQQQRKLEQLDQRAKNQLSKFQTILAQLAATNLITHQQVEEIKRIGECDINQASDMTLVDFREDVRDKVLKSNSNDGRENLMDQFRGMSCLLIGSRHLKDIVRKLWRVLGRVQPSNNKRLLRLVLKGKKRRKGEMKSRLRESALHDKIRGFFQQIVKLEHNTVQLRSQLQELKQASNNLLFDGNQLKNKFSSLRI